MLIGSKAAKIHFSDFPRDGKDWDYISPTKLPETDTHYFPEFEQIKALYPFDIAPPELLYTIKLSHSFWNIKWPKTEFDILFFQSKGIKLDENVFDILYKVWERVHGKKKAYLNKDNDNFFKDNVKRVYEHDSIHEAMAYYDRPLFERIKDDLNKALCSRNLFWKLSHEDRLKCCREEIYVTALERFLIPSDFTVNHIKAYRDAGKKLITSMSKGYFPKFIIENWLELRNPDIDYVQKFKSKFGIDKNNKMEYDQKNMKLEEVRSQLLAREDDFREFLKFTSKGELFGAWSDNKGFHPLEIVEINSSYVIFTVEGKYYRLFSHNDSYVDSWDSWNVQYMLFLLLLFNVLPHILNGKDCTFMTKTEIRIAVAECCGWKNIGPYGHSNGQNCWIKIWDSSSQKYTFNAVPDYPNDLNAMLEARKFLTNDERRNFLYKLMEHLDIQYSLSHCDYNHIYKILNSDALQQAVVFLIVKNKFKVLSIQDVTKEPFKYASKQFHDGVAKIFGL